MNDVCPILGLYMQTNQTRRSHDYFVALIRCFKDNRHRIRSGTVLPYERAYVWMVVSARSWLRRLFFIVLLSFFTIAMYGGCRFIATWIAPDDPYRVPQGKALKVFNEERLHMDSTTFSERLKLFYWYGE